MHDKVLLMELQQLALMCRYTRDWSEIKIGLTTEGLFISCRAKTEGRKLILQIFLFSSIALFMLDYSRN